jgi:leucyl-tRNA synthetase
LRYIDPANEHQFTDPALAKRWMPIDRYSGGSEHTTLHLLYARFFTKVLYDLALSPVSEPFTERFNRGLILGPDGQKMSKSKGNVINPDEVVAKFGADAVRMYMAFMGPYNEPGNYPWNLDGTLAIRRFLDRIYVLAGRVEDIALSEEMARIEAQAIQKVATDIDRFKFNTAISSLMVFVRDLEAQPSVPRSTMRTLVQLVAPFAPHLAEHLWESLAGEGSVHAAAWPAADESLLKTASVSVTVQVNGKRRGEVLLAPDAPEEEALAAARALSAIATVGEPKRVIYVPGRILNLVL